MVDLVGQYERLRPDIDAAIAEVLASARFIGGPVVEGFERSLAEYLGVEHVVSCANGTDALQLALMALDLQPGDEVIVPAFTYVATAEVIALLRLRPVMVDVDERTFNLTGAIVEAAITDRTKAVVPVHLFGQGAEMDAIVEVADRHGLYVVEDNAQAIGARFVDRDGQRRSLGSFGNIGTTSFFPSKNLGCYGDGGALYTDDATLAEKLRMLRNHGQKKRYYHEIVGVNSRLDAIQAAVLHVKLAHLDDFIARRRRVADAYDAAFRDIDGLVIPWRDPRSDHVFHQYTLRVMDGKRDALRAHLERLGISTNIYYPVPLYRQKAFEGWTDVDYLPVTERLCEEVLSLPIHTEMDDETLEYIVDGVRSFFRVRS